MTELKNKIGLNLLEVRTDADDCRFFVNDFLVEDLKRVYIKRKNELKKIYFLPIDIYRKDVKSISLSGGLYNVIRKESKFFIKDKLFGVVYYVPLEKFMLKNPVMFVLPEDVVLKLDGKGSEFNLTRSRVIC